MKKIAVISFTKKGEELGEELKNKCFGYFEIQLFTRFKQSRHYMKETLYEWTKDQFQTGNTILFIGAVGIAVRTVAPFLKSKLEDPAVLVMDEKGQFVIPVLSGHVGGANEVATKIAEILHTVPVITTATDLNHKFAVDLFAKKNHLHIVPKNGIAKCSSKILAGENLTIACDKEIDGEVPKQVIVKTFTQENIKSRKNMSEMIDVNISVYKNENANLSLVPRCIVVGIGCKKGKSAQEILKVLEEVLEQNQITPDAITKITSIDIKKEEQGIIDISKKMDVEFETFSAEQLRQVRGNFKSSTFVKNQVGVDNVCGRSALAGCGESGRLLVDKYAKNGVTIGIAQKEWSVHFYE